MKTTKQDTKIIEQSIPVAEVKPSDILKSQGRSRFASLHKLNSSRSVRPQKSMVGLKSFKPNRLVVGLKKTE